MKYLFWNTNCKNIEVNDIIVEIVKEYSCDIIALAEYRGIEDLDSLITSLNNIGNKKYIIDRRSQLIGTEKIKIIISISSNFLEETLIDTGNYVIKKLDFNKFGVQLIGCVHLPSKIYDDRRAASVDKFKREVTIENIRMDALCNIKGDGLEGYLIVEVELSNNNVSRKLMRYEDLFLSRKFKKHFDVMPKLLYVSDQRVHSDILNIINIKISNL